MDEMSSSDSDENNCTSPDIAEAAISLPDKSRSRYEKVYQCFMEWRDDNKVNSFSENVMLAYFGHLTEKYKSSSLWNTYSILRSTINVRHNIKIETYRKLKAFLKRQADGYKAKKAKIFTSEEINAFIENADDKKYLATKVALIIGILGACRCHELKQMNISHIEDLNTSMMITVPNKNKKIVRKFTVAGKFYEIVKKYYSMRPAIALPYFFLSYQNGKCYPQSVGINKFSSMGKQIATFLNLPNPELYSGYSFRRSSARLLVDSGTNVTALRKHWGLRYRAAGEDYVEDSINNEMTTAQKNIQSEQSEPTTTIETRDVHEDLMDVATPSLTITRPELKVNNCLIKVEPNLVDQEEMEEVEEDSNNSHISEVKNEQVKEDMQLQVTNGQEDFTIFGRYVAEELRHLPLQQSLLAKKQIILLLTDMRYQFISNSQSSSNLADPLFTPESLDNNDCI